MITLTPNFFCKLLSGLDTVLEANKSVVSGEDPIKVDLAEVPRALKDLLGMDGEKFEATFSMPIRDKQIYFTRTYPLVESLATYVMDTTLDEVEDSVAKRCGASHTRQVETCTTLLLLRMSYHLITTRGNIEPPLLAEEVLPPAFTGVTERAEWLDIESAERLVIITPNAKIHPQQSTQFIQRMIDNFESIQLQLELATIERAEALLISHRRVQDAAKHTGRYRGEPQLPPDVLGIYIYLPT